METLSRPKLEQLVGEFNHTLFHKETYCAETYAQLLHLSLQKTLAAIAKVHPRTMLDGTFENENRIEKIV